jgi:hypothetical protein
MARRSVVARPASPRIAGEPLDPEKLHHVLRDFDTLFTVASAAERKEPLELR